MADVLAKATGAISEFLRVQYCLGCMAAPSDCSVSRCPVHELRHHDARDLARAVLEAAGYDKLQAVAEAARQYLERCHRDGCMPIAADDDVRCGTDDCYEEQLWAALGRAGKEWDRHA